VADSGRDEDASKQDASDYEYYVHGAP
jgi:hypothetical protein